MQQMFTMIQANAQRQVMLKGFGNTLCARVSFKKVDFTLKVFQVLSELFFHVLFLIIILL